MGQTLTHGVYLPDEGERNCYSGLAANWQILDGSVGTIAAHTAALSGKAPLVHTHTVSQITDFPAYGNAAGTICEGNDSRLSDARTPLSHTHTKANITDLLNSNFIPSANNSYGLGSSSYQWNNLYAKNYYYNGVAWGLDKANVWSDSQTVLKNSEALYVLKRSNLKLGDPIPQTTQVLGTFAFTGSDGANAGIVTFRDGSNGDTSLIISARQRYNSNGDRDPSGFQYETRMDIGVDSSRNRYIRPNSNGDVNLGTSTNKWKSLNGINPGALSLPDLSVYQNIDTNGWVYDGIAMNNILLNSGDTNVTKNGWLYVRTNNTVAGDRIAVRLNFIYAEYPTIIVGELGFGHIELFVPLVAGYKAYVFTNKAPTYIRFYPCLGNVPSGV